MINWENCVIDQSGRGVTLTRAGREIVRIELGHPLLGGESGARPGPELSELDRREEDDEIEFRWLAGPLEIRWRHSAELVWSMRIAITNTSDEPVELIGLPLDVSTGEDRTGWAVRARAEASITILGEPEDTLWIDVVQGNATGQGADFLIGNIRLQPGQQQVTRLRGDWVSDLRARTAARHSVLPPWAHVEHTESVVLDHPDLAVVSTDGHADAQGRTELIGSPGASSLTRLSGPRGDVDVVITFAPDLDQVIVDRVQQLRTRWRSSRQGPVIESVDQAILAQHALATGLAPDRDSLGAAVEGAVARFRDQPSMLVMVLMSQQGVVTGDDQLVADALAMSLLLSDEPGLSLGWVRLIAAATMMGVDLAPALGRQRSSVRPGGHPSAHQLARDLGYGLRGSRLAAIDPSTDARDVALLAQWLATGHTAPTSWPVDGRQLVQRHSTRLRHLAATGALSELGLTWLVLADQFI